MTNIETGFYSLLKSGLIEGDNFKGGLVYDSILVYAVKSIKGNLRFSMLITLVLTHILTLTSIYTLVWQHEVFLNDSRLFFRAMSIYSLFICIVIITVALAFLYVLYIFSQNGRMFATLRIFGARRIALVRLVTLQTFMYTLACVITSALEMFVLYMRYKNYISTIGINLDIIASLKLILISNSAVIICFIIVAIIGSALFLIKPPYENMKGTL